jgi:hypothetical protein
LQQQSAAVRSRQPQRSAAIQKRQRWLHVVEAEVEAAVAAPPTSTGHTARPGFKR